MGVIFLAITGFILFQSIFSSISLFYYTKDNEYILPLPIKPSQIVMAKTNVLIITEYFIVAIIGLIPLLIYGILTGASALYYIVVIKLLIIFPILPSLISNFIVMIVMSFARFTKNKNRFQVIAFILIMLFAIIFSTSMSKKEASEEEVIQLVMQANGLTQMLKGYFPTLGPAIEALTSQSLLQASWNLIQIVGITIVSYIVYIALASKLYFRGVIGNSSSGVKSKKKLNENKAYHKINLARTYIGKEFKILIRNPVFLMQCIIPSLIFPVVFLVIPFMGVQQENMGELSGMISSISSNITKTALIGGVILCIIQFFSMFVYISITAISRDGQNANFMKYIPVPYTKQIEYKIMPNIIMSTIMNVMVMILVQIILPIPIIYTILILITATIISILQSYIMILIDLKKPKLEWSSEYAVVKQNINLMWPAILGFANITILTIICGMSMLLPINAYIVIGVIALSYLLIVFKIRQYIEKNQIKLFEKIF